MLKADARAGEYIQQLSGIRTFCPAVLPPTPPIMITDELQEQLSDANLALGRLDGSITTLPNADLFVTMYVRKEAVLSSQIEGTQSSLQDLLAAEAKVYSTGGSGDVNEVSRYVKAMNYGLQRLDTLPVSVRLIREIHRELITGGRGDNLKPGDIRTSQNWIGPAGCTVSEATFVPPPPELLPQALADLEKFIHSDEPIPLLLKIGLTHAQFETIHPFLDGNGRVGRLIITFLLCERKILQKPVLYLSYFFKQYRQEYYERLQSIRETGDWEGWLLFYLKGISEVSIDASNTASEILLLREEHRALIINELGRSAGNGLLLLEELYQQPITSTNNVTERLGISYQSANNLITGFVDLGILQELTGRKRNRRFIYQTFTDLFSDE